MANNYMILDAVFEPYTYDSMIKPIAVLNDAHNAIEDNYAKLIEESSIWERLKDSPLDKDLYDRYKAFDDAAMAAYMKFNEEGLTGNSRLDLHKIRKDYHQQIMPIVAADSARAALIQARDAAREKDKTVRFENDPANTPLSYYINNPTTTLGARYSGEELRKTMATEAKNFKTLPNIFRTFYNELDIPYSQQIDGLLAGDLEEVLSNEELRKASSEIILLRNLVNRITDTAVQEWEDPEKKAIARREAIEFVKQGVYEALGTAKYNQVNIPMSQGREGGGKAVVPAKKVGARKLPETANREANDKKKEDFKKLDDLYNSPDKLVKDSAEAKGIRLGLKDTLYTYLTPEGDTRYRIADRPYEYTEGEKEKIRKESGKYEEYIDSTIAEFEGMLMEDGIEIHKDDTTGNYIMTKTTYIDNIPVEENRSYTPKEMREYMRTFQKDNEQYAEAGHRRYAPNYEDALESDIVEFLIRDKVIEAGKVNTEVPYYLYNMTTGTLEQLEGADDWGWDEHIPGVLVKMGAAEKMGYNDSNIELKKNYSELLGVQYDLERRLLIIYPKNKTGEDIPAIAIKMSEAKDVFPEDAEIQQLMSQLDEDHFLARNGDYVFKNSTGDGLRYLKGSELANGLFVKLANRNATKLKTTPQNIKVTDQKVSINNEEENTEE